MPTPAPVSSLSSQMFMPTIMSQGTPEQQAKWMPLCRSLRVRPVVPCSDRQRPPGGPHLTPGSAARSLSPADHRHVRSD
jgi:hypothetical protein